jgi:hypothetical protein
LHGPETIEEGLAETPLHGYQQPISAVVDDLDIAERPSVHGDGPVEHRQEQGLQSQSFHCPPVRLVPLREAMCISVATIGDLAYGVCRRKDDNSIG